MPDFVALWLTAGAALAVAFAIREGVCYEKPDGFEFIALVAFSIILPPLAAIWMVWSMRSTLRHRNHMQSESAVMVEIYKRYVAECKRADVDPLSRSDQWTAHWSTVARINELQSELDAR